VNCFEKVSCEIRPFGVPVSAGSEYDAPDSHRVFKLSRTNTTNRHRRSGFALLGILIIIMLASMVAISLLFRMRAEEMASAAGETSEQAFSAAMCGVEEALRIVAQSDPEDVDWMDSPDLFKDRFIFDDGADQWFFTIYGAGADPDSVRYGLTGESGKLNLNEAGKEMLAKLPGLKASQAQALWDFLDADSQPEPEGAEQEYYDTLATPYSIRNGPLDTVDELLMVREFTPAVVYGEDANQNCRLDPNEDDGSEQYPPDNNDGVLNRGLRDVVTARSYELNADSSGFPRTDVNNAADPLDTNALPAEVVQYIEALRRSKVRLMHPAELLGAKGTFKDDKGKPVELESGVGKEELPTVLDLLTAETTETIAGLININTASAAVLQTIPGFDASIAEAIVGARHGLTPDKRSNPAWIFQEDVVGAEAFKTAAPYITTRTWQFTFYVIGYGLPSGRFRVLEVTIDNAADEAAVTDLRDITRLGLPFPLIEDPAAFAARTKPHSKSEQVRHLERPLNRTLSHFRERNNG
jgi:DNA uptake protein ComE-like DNA-binding protein